MDQHETKETTTTSSFFNQKRKFILQSDSSSLGLQDDLIDVPSPKKKHKPTPVSDYLTSTAPTSDANAEETTTSEQSTPNLQKASSIVAAPVDSLSSINNIPHIPIIELDEQTSINGEFQKQKLEENSPHSEHENPIQEMQPRHILGLQANETSENEGDDNIFKEYNERAQSYFTFYLPKIDKKLRKMQTKCNETHSKTKKQYPFTSANNQNEKSIIKSHNSKTNPIKVSQLKYHLKQSQQGQHHQNLFTNSPLLYNNKGIPQSQQSLIMYQQQQLSINDIKKHDKFKQINLEKPIQHLFASKDVKASNNPIDDSSMHQDKQSAQKLQIVSETSIPEVQQKVKRKYTISATSKQIRLEEKERKTSLKKMDKDSESSSVVQTLESINRTNLSPEVQLELLKYHKKSKNYHGTAKQFNVSHEEVRFIMKSRKKEYKALPNI